MKIFILPILILVIYLPAFAQECEESDVHLLREGDIVFLKECRLGTLDNPLMYHVGDFLEVNEDDSTLMSAFNVLEVDVYGSVDRVLFDSDTPVTISLFTHFENMESIEYFADRYRQWTAENNDEKNYSLHNLQQDTML